MNLQAVFIAFAAAAAGAVIWGLVAYFSEYELGILAWGIGAAIGWAGVIAGGRGFAMAVLCAALTLASIGGGKVLMAMMLLQDYTNEAASPQQLRSYYEMDLKEAEAATQLQSDQDIAQFLVQYGYSEASSASAVPPEEIAMFRADVLPVLMMIAENQPSFEEWQELRGEMEVTFGEKLAFSLQVAGESLGFMDVLFAGLGIMSAGGMIMRATREEG